jgi:subtilisin family serine protease
MAAALAAPGAAVGARYAVGLQDGVAAQTVAVRLGAITGRRAESLAPLPALIVEARDRRSLARIPGVAWVEPVTARRRLAFEPTDPLASLQWYLQTDRVFDYWSDYARPPSLPGVRVAVIDSGIDVGHPEFKGRIAAARSFVRGGVRDADGHGTFVAGVIAAGLDNDVGIAGMAFPAQLLVAKVVDPDGTISPEAEARAIRWAIAQGARVINMSIGGLRDPRDLARDMYSKLEAAAIGYAIKHGAVVVAAAGNADDAPKSPWPYASYPAALPHVIGVAALQRNGDISSFSDRDPIYVDLAAPGEQILSTFPRALTALRPRCPDQGYSSCGPSEYRDAEGTSFAAPQVTAAVALLLSRRPRLSAAQAATLVERSASDVNAASGCRRCPLLRDSFSGWGALNVEATLRALAGPLPPRDLFEPNDGVADAYPLWGLPRTVNATLDYWDDPLDVYRVRLRAGQSLVATFNRPTGVQSELALWRTGTPTLEVGDPRGAGYLVATTGELMASQRLVAVAPVAGFYLLAIRATTPGGGAYLLRVARATP